MKYNIRIRPPKINYENWKSAKMIKKRFNNSLLYTGVFDTKNMNSSRGKNLTQKLIIDN